MLALRQHRGHAELQGGSWLACDSNASVHRKYRGACIAGKPGSHMDRAHLHSVLLIQPYFMLVNASFTPIAINTAPMVRSNQCPIRANPARTRCWLNSIATRQNHSAVATARYTP